MPKIGALEPDDKEEKKEEKKDDSLLEMVTGEKDRDQLVPEETSEEMMASALGIPPGEHGMQEAFDDITGMPADSDGDGKDDNIAMDDITGMGKGEYKKITGMDDKAYEQITGMKPGSYQKITGMDDKAWEELTGEKVEKLKSKSKIVSKGKKRSSSHDSMIDDITGLHAGYMEDIG